VAAVKNRLQHQREVCGLSLAQAAQQLGWAQGPLHAMESGQGSPPTEADLGELAKLYGCSIAWLLGETAELGDENKAMLDTIEHTSDRAIVREFIEMLSTRDPCEPVPPTSAVRLTRVRAWDSPSTSDAAQEEADRRADADLPVARKRRYVRSQKQTRKHHCHWPGCEAQVPPAMWGCKAHWFKLPKALRDRIWRTYAPGQEVDMTPSAEYLQVADDVQRWIREQSRP
jgi:transcriptional regulator with XRE-family HTH domain